MPLVLALDVLAVAGRWEARVAGDSAVHVLVSPSGDDRVTAYVSGRVITRSAAVSALPIGLPIDISVPPLAIRLNAGDRATDCGI